MYGRRLETLWLIFRRQVRSSYYKYETGRKFQSLCNNYILCFIRPITRLVIMQSMTLLYLLLLLRVIISIGWFSVHCYLWPAADFPIVTWLFHFPRYISLQFYPIHISHDLLQIRPFKRAYVHHQYSCHDVVYALWHLYYVVQFVLYSVYVVEFDAFRFFRYMIILNPSFSLLINRAFNSIENLYSLYKGFMIVVRRVRFKKSTNCLQNFFTMNIISSYYPIRRQCCIAFASHENVVSVFPANVYSAV